MIICTSISLIKIIVGNVISPASGYIPNTKYLGLERIISPKHFYCIIVHYKAILHLLLKHVLLANQRQY